MLEYISLIVPMQGFMLAVPTAGIGFTANLQFPCQLKQAAPLKESLWTFQPMHRG